jgi:hypothetical protein
MRNALPKIFNSDEHEDTENRINNLLLDLNLKFGKIVIQRAIHITSSGRIDFQAVRKDCNE